MSSYFADELKAQAVAQKMAAEQCSKQESMPVGALGSNAYTRRTSLRDIEEKEVHYMHEQIQKKQQAIAFLTANPAFDEFITLVKRGVISL